jgi:hypothetical protein
MPPGLAGYRQTHGLAAAYRLASGISEQYHLRPAPMDVMRTVVSVLGCVSPEDDHNHRAPP